MEDSDVLWKKHCQHEFKGTSIRKEEDESWRETYVVSFLHYSLALYYWCYSESAVFGPFSCGKLFIVENFSEGLLE